MYAAAVPVLVTVTEPAGRVPTGVEPKSSVCGLISSRGCGKPGVPGPLIGIVVKGCAGSLLAITATPLKSPTAVGVTVPLIIIVDQAGTVAGNGVVIEKVADRWSPTSIQAMRRSSGPRYANETGTMPRTRRPRPTPPRRRACCCPRRRLVAGATEPSARLKTDRSQAGSWMLASAIPSMYSDTGAWTLADTGTASCMMVSERTWATASPVPLTSTSSW